MWYGAWSGGSWLSAGGLFRCRCPCLAVWSASLLLMWFAVVPCLPVLCSVVLCCRLVLCCCALLSFCGVVGARFALLWPVLLCCVALMVVTVVFCPGGGVCVLWSPFPPCRHTHKTLIITLSDPVSVSVSVLHVVGEPGLAVRRLIADCGRVVFDKVVLFVVDLACLQRDGGRTLRGSGRDGKGRYMGRKTKREGASLEA